MSTITQIVKSWDLQGVYDNTQDFIDEIVPLDTPFYNSIPKVSARSNSFTWVQDYNDQIGVVGGRQEAVLASQVTAGSPEDGSVSDESKRLNYAQIFRKFVTVTKTANASGIHGKSSESVYQLAKATTAIKNQIEGTFLSGQIKQAASATTSALTDGYTSQIPAECIVMGDITAANVETLIQALFANGSTADTIFTNALGAKALKHLMDVGDSVGPKHQVLCTHKETWVDGKGVSMTDEVTIEHFSFTDSNGRTYKVYTSRHLDKQNPDAAIAYFFNSDDFTCVEFRPLTIKKLDTQGSYDQWLIDCEVGLRHNGRHKAGFIQGTATPPAPPVTAKTAKAAK